MLRPQNNTRINARLSWAGNTSSLDDTTRAPAHPIGAGETGL